MLFKLRQRHLLLFVFAIVGLSIGLLPNFQPLHPVRATAPPTQMVETRSATELETQGKYFYTIAQFQAAADLWQQAIESYEPQDSLNRARVMSNLALAQG
ncbi:MAG: hypothetical protein AAFY50_25145, partial [Cyanobacteria bacterium J06648_1]